MNRTKLLHASIQNFAAQILPAVAAVVSIPVLIHRLGHDKFGALSLGLSIVGYFSILDFGLGRAMVREISIRIEKKEEKTISDLFWGANLMLLVVGIVASAGVFFSAASIVHGVQKIPSSIQIEVIRFFCILSLNLPLILLQSSISAVPMGHQEFRGLNVIRTLYGSFSFLGLIPLVHVTTDLSWFAGAITIMRLLSVIGLTFVSRSVAPYLTIPKKINIRQVLPLFSEGGWMWFTILLAYLFMFSDRFLISAVNGLAAVTAYTTSMDALSKISLIHGAVTVALFPGLARMLNSDPTKGRALALDVANMILMISSPILLWASWLAPEWLTFWLGPELANSSSTVSRIICVGLIFNCVANIPYNQLQAAGKSKTVALLQALEFFPYMILLWLLVKTFGIAGAGAAWAIRLAVDWFVLVVASAKDGISASKSSSAEWLPKRLLISTSIAAIVIGMPLPSSFLLRIIGAVLATLLLVILFWRILLSPNARQMILARWNAWRIGTIINGL